MTLDKGFFFLFHFKVVYAVCGILLIQLRCLVAGANNLIPMEIALKIADKIKANERFAAYIVIPMWPEGVPTGAATQRILFWQVILVTILLSKTRN